MIVRKFLKRLSTADLKKSLKYEFLAGFALALAIFIASFGSIVSIEFVYQGF